MTSIIPTIQFKRKFLDYLPKLPKKVTKVCQKTFIDSSLLPLAREFTEEEIQEWIKEDIL